MQNHKDGSGLSRTLFLVLLFFSCLGLAQVFVPVSFWSGANPVVTISDANTYNYGSISTAMSVDKTFSVANTGAEAANIMSGAAFTNSSYSYKGGSYPGTGGTCSTVLNPNASCTVIVTAYSTTTGTSADSLRISFRSTTANTSSTRPITATFVATATQLAWVTTPNFIKVNDCQAVTIQRQDNAGNPVTIASTTNITNLIFNNGVNGTYYTNSSCSTSTTTATIASGANSITVYFQSTTSAQTGILVATATGLISASQNVTITTAPSKLFINPSPTIKTGSCSPVTVTTVDANNFASNAGSTVTVNFTTTGANSYYSDVTCLSSITSSTVAAGTSVRSVYTSNATIQTATLTAADAAATLTSSSKNVNFNSSTTWWNSSWTKRIRIDINNTDQATAFSNQPVLVRLNSTIVTYSDFLANGADVRFVASDDTTQLNHEFDYWNYGGTSEIWVRIPSISASSMAGYFYMYFNNSSATDGQNANGVWTNYWSVWHLGQDPSGTAPQYSDSTSSARHATATNSPARAIGQIGYAADLNGSTDAVDVNANLSTALGNSSTMSFWMRSTQVGNDTMWQAPGITGIEQSGGGNDIFFGWVDNNSGNSRIGVTAGNGASAKSNFQVNNNAWRHVTISRDSSTGGVIFYINGVQNGTATSESGAKTTYFDLLGEIGDTGGTPTNYNGYLDEVRIVNSVRTAAQIQADFKYMMNTHVIYNSVESGP